MNLLSKFFGIKHVQTIHVGGDGSSLALIDASRYEGFIRDGDWGKGDKLIKHLREQARDLRVLLWLTGMERDWKVEVHIGAPSVSIDRDRVGLITAKSDRLHLMNYDSLTMAAQFEDHHLPDKETKKYAITVSPGSYLCTLQTLFEPGEIVQAEGVAFRIYLQPLDAVALVEARKRSIQAFVDDPVFSDSFIDQQLLQSEISPDRTIHVSSIERQLAKDFADVMHLLHPGWIRAFYRGGADGPMSPIGYTASYVMPDGVKILSMLDDHAGVFARMNENGRELLLGKGQPIGVILLVVDADGQYSTHYEFKKMRRWRITKLNGATGEPDGWKP